MGTSSVASLAILARYAFHDEERSNSGTSH
jgi:hypothetical protein